MIWHDKNSLEVVTIVFGLVSDILANLWPTGQVVAGTLNMRIQQLDVACETKTFDNVFCNVVVSVQYQVKILVFKPKRLTYMHSIDMSS